MTQLTVGTPADNPAADDVLVTSQVVTAPRQYTVRLTIVTEGNLWAALVHRASGGGARSTILVPVSGPILGPVDFYTTYFHSGDYVEVAIRAGAETVTGTVQATVELV